MEIKLVNEGVKYIVDSCGRAVVPSHLRAKYGIEGGDTMYYYTAEGPNGEIFICMTKTNPNGDQE